MLTCKIAEANRGIIESIEREISVIIIYVVLSGVLIGRETITSLQITAYE